MISSTISFSSYPGAISSTDDFMLTKETRLAITETSLGPRATKNWGSHDFVERERKHVPDYVHIMVVTRLARSGWDWMRKFTDETNSKLTGVYNSQWMVLDYWKFQNRNRILIIHILSTNC